MAVEIDLAPRHGPFAGTLDPAAIDQYAAATNDTNAPVATGTAVPATFPVILIFDAQWAANAAVPKSVYASGRNGVHGEHEVLLHRPLVPGETLDTFSEPFAVRNTQRRCTRRAAHGAVRRRRARSRSSTGGRSSSPAATSSPTWGRNHPTTRSPTRPVRTRSARSTQHVDVDIAPVTPRCRTTGRRTTSSSTVRARPGVDYLFAHGLCTMAMCTQAAVGMVADGDPSHVSVGLRCGSRHRPGSTGPHRRRVRRSERRLGATRSRRRAQGAAVIKHGRLELFS